jgi:hypothetical protein
VAYFKVQSKHLPVGDEEDRENISPCSPVVCNLCSARNCVGFFCLFIAFCKR